MVPPPLDTAEHCEVLTLTKNMRPLFGASVVDIEVKRQFSEWVLSIGDGRIGEDNEVDKTVVVPSDLLIESAETLLLLLLKARILTSWRA